VVNENIARPTQSPFNLSGRAAIVTGASGGIGASIARALALAGVSVAVHYKSGRDNALKVVESITAFGGIALPVEADLAEESEVVSLMDNVEQVFGGIDILVNNAGKFPNQSIRHMTINEWREMYRTNVETAFLCVRTAIPYLELSKSASIINIASISALSPSSDHSHYNSSKAALVSFSASAAQELGPKRIRVNCISPGLIWREGIEEDWPDGVERWMSKVPLGRLGLPEDIANGCLFLASSASAWITGQNLIIDGGILSTSIY